MSSIQKDSLLNEYKGNLFEFLVAQKLSQVFKVEANFLNGLGESFFAILREQEKFLSKEYPHLLKDLPILANVTSQKILSKISFGPIDEVLLIGKKAAASGDLRFSECDILLKGAQDFPISLKLSKKGAFVNTKSAGLKSFLSKYFFKLNGDTYQRELDSFVEVEFEAMARKLYEEHELEFDKSFNNWRKADLPERPGELCEVDKTHLHHYYHRLNTKLYQIIETLMLENIMEFSQSLHALMGQSHVSIIQVTCYYENKHSHYEVCDIEVSSGTEVLQVSLNPLNKDVGNFVLSMPKKLLQIRIKPMKTFTQPSFKINCSVKSI